MQFTAHAYDPPSGWMYGFPKPWPRNLVRTQENIRAQLVKDEYRGDLDLAVRHCRFIGTPFPYEDWIEAVDDQMIKLYGVRLDELPDWMSRDAYEDGMSPVEAAYECAEQVGLYETLKDEL